MSPEAAWLSAVLGKGSVDLGPLWGGRSARKHEAVLSPAGDPDCYDTHICWSEEFLIAVLPQEFLDARCSRQILVLSAAACIR